MPVLLLLFRSHIAQSAEPEVTAMKAKLACPSFLETWPLWILFPKSTHRRESSSKVGGGSDHSGIIRQVLGPRKPAVILGSCWLSIPPGQKQSQRTVDLVLVVSEKQAIWSPLNRPAIVHRGSPRPEK